MNLYATDLSPSACFANLDIARKLKQQNILASTISSVVHINPTMAALVEEEIAAFIDRNTTRYGGKPKTISLKDSLEKVNLLEHPLIAWGNASAFNFYILCDFYLSGRQALIIFQGSAYSLRRRELDAIISWTHRKLQELTSVPLVLSEYLLYRHTKEQYSNIKSVTEAYRRQLIDLWKEDLLAAEISREAIEKYNLDPVGKVKPRVKKPPRWNKYSDELKYCPKFAYDELIKYKEELLHARRNTD